jgi:hypothetical protein
MDDRDRPPELRLAHAEDAVEKVGRPEQDEPPDLVHEQLGAHEGPGAPVTMKAAFQPKASAIGGISSGVRIAPTFGAVFISPIPSDRSLMGR